MAKKETKTELSDLGEFGLIRKITKDVKIQNSSTVKGVGDDAAVLSYKNKETIVTTDMLVEGVHFDLAYMPLKHLGYKAVIVNLSDVYAMNALPKQITVSIAVSNRFPLEAIEELYKGIGLACERYKVDLVGGDTASSTTGLIISITAIGEAEEKDITYRTGAKVNDLLCVSGDLGGAYMGLQLLEREKKIFAETKVQPEFAGYDYIIERQLKPEARDDIIQVLKDLKVKPSSMIDISDGLSSEILHICIESKVGCSLFEEKIPMDAATIEMSNELSIDPTTCALSGGEDYELLFTIPIEHHDKVKDNPYFTIIGHITDKSEGANLITKAENVIPLTAQGWDAMLSNDDE